MILFYWLIGIMPLDNHPLWARHIVGMTILRWIGIVCVFYALFYLGQRRSTPGFFRTWPSRLFMVFFVLASLSYFIKDAPIHAPANLYITYTSFAILLFVTLILVDSLRRFRFALLWVAGSVGWASLYLIRQWQESGFNAAYRAGWIINPNDFAALVDLCLPIACFLLLERRPRWERLFLAGCIASMLLGALTAASRGGLLGLVPGLGLLVWRSKRRARSLLLSVVVLFVLILAPASPLAQRMFHPTQADRNSTMLRETLWTAGLHMIEHHPVFGVGVGRYKSAVGQYTSGDIQFQAHNTYIEMAAELGLPGLIIFLAILFCTYWNLERMRRRTLRSGPPLLRQAIPGMQAGLLGCSVALVFSSLENLKTFWFLIFLTMCLPPLVSEAKRKESSKRGLPVSSAPPRIAGRLTTARQKLKRILIRPESTGSSDRPRL